jgi:hypothetical protein
MRRRSLTGPLLLLIVGSLFLWKNLHPESNIFDLVALYWPFLLIGWGVLRLGETLIWNHQGVRSGLSGGEIALIVIICIAGSGFVQAHRSGWRITAEGLDIWGQEFNYPVGDAADADKPILLSAAGIKRIVLDNPQGNVKILGTTSDQAQVTGRKLVRAYSRQDADRANADSAVVVTPEGDRLVVRVSSNGAARNRRVTVDLDISIPRGMIVESHAVTGDYEIDDIAGDVDLAVERSSLIRANAIKGNLDLNCNGSDLEVEDVGGQVTVTGSFDGNLGFKNIAKPLLYTGTRNTEVHVQAVPGVISMDLSRLSGKDLVGPIRLMAASRDVNLEKFTASLEIEAQRGDIELTPGSTPLPAIDARSSNGRIELVLPAKANFVLDATAEIGDAVNDFGPAIRKDTSGRSATLTGRVGEGPTVRLNARRGWISVRKEGSPSSLPPHEDQDTEKSKGTDL